MYDPCFEFNGDPIGHNAKCLKRYKKQAFAKKGDEKILFFKVFSENK